MKAETGEWITKADGDFETASRERSVVDRPNHDAVCFHSQQAAEKYLKARLVEAGLAFPRTHDLGILLGLAVAAEPAWETLRADLETLTSMGTEVRYPGVSADTDDAGEALRIAALVRSAVCQVLGLGVTSR